MIVVSYGPRAQPEREPPLWRRQWLRQDVRSAPELELLRTGQRHPAPGDRPALPAAIASFTRGTRQVDQRGPRAERRSLPPIGPVNTRPPFSPAWRGNEGGHRISRLWAAGRMAAGYAGAGYSSKQLGYLAVAGSRALSTSWKTTRS